MDSKRDAIDQVAGNEDALARDESRPRQEARGEQLVAVAREDAGHELLLPARRKDYVDLDDIRCDKPQEPTEAPLLRRTLCDESTGDQGVCTQQGSAFAKGKDEVDSVVITPDLVCSVCEQPDNEAQMLVCDCKAGYHIYCLTPPLDEVPEGEWQCPTCANKA